MGEMKVEHVLLFLVGAFLVYHMMGKCRRVEGAFWSPSSLPNCSGNRAFDSGCEGQSVWDTSKNQEQARQSCSNYWNSGLLNNYQCDGEPVKAHNPITNKYYWECREGNTQCLDP